MNKIKKIVCFLALPLILCVGKVNAGYLLIEDERDIERVSNNFAYFYRENRIDLEEINKLGFDSNKCSSHIQSIMSNSKGITGGIVRSFREELNRSVEDYYRTSSYIKSNTVKIKLILKEKSTLNDFIKGYNLMGHILPIIANRSL